jgi:glycerate kinase
MKRPKKIVIAMDSFKGSVSSVRAGACVKKGIAEVFPDVDVRIVAVADGGEGSLSSVLNNCRGAKIMTETVTAPDGSAAQAEYLLLGGKTAVIEMAQASGLTLVPESKRNARAASTFGTGELLNAAVKAGAKDVILFVGGSATSDGGLGAARAMGLRFFDRDQREVMSAKNLSDIAAVDTSQKNPGYDGVRITVACDVENPLCGEFGAAYVYAPQKGANGDDCAKIDAGLSNLAGVIERDVGRQLSDIAGMGAAGGIMLPLYAYFNAERKSGIELILDIADFDTALKGADLVITGEGRLDGQSAYGKAISGIGTRAKEANVPVIAINGSLGKGYRNIYSRGINAVFNIQDRPMTYEESLSETEDLLADCAARIMRLL